LLLASGQISANIRRQTCMHDVAISDIQPGCKAGIGL
jgi:hypothetical protein